MPAAQLSLHSPVGDLTISRDGDAIVSADWGWAPEQSRHDMLLCAAKAQLEAYFDGTLQDFDLPLNAQGTPEQTAVWQAMLEIPYGVVKTYGEIARLIGSNPRLVGDMCGANPIPIIIPCHRVVGAGGEMTGYSGAGGVETKQALLRLEGYLLL